MKLFWWCTLVGGIALVTAAVAWAGLAAEPTPEARFASASEPAPEPEASQAVAEEGVDEDAAAESEEAGADAGAGGEGEAAESAEGAAAGGDTPSLVRRVWTVIGVFHPAIIHFPIVLLTLAALLVMLRAVFRSVPEDLAFYCLVLGAAAAVAASVIGWSFANQQGYVRVFDTGSRDAATMFFHRWFGIGTTLLAVVFAVVAVMARRRGRRDLRVTWQLGAVGTAALVGLVGHWGGSLVYGHDMYARAFERFVESGRPAAAATPVDEPEGSAADGSWSLPVVTMPEDGVIYFATHIQPILEANCLECHGARRQRGDLRLDNREDAFASEFVIVPGDPEDSDLYFLITDEVEMMPPEENGGPLAEEEIELIRMWIEQGAEWPEGLVLRER